MPHEGGIEVRLGKWLFFWWRWSRQDLPADENLTVEVRKVDYVLTVTVYPSILVVIWQLAHFAVTGQWWLP